jgi:class 3 adenylate cyclase
VGVLNTTIVTVLVGDIRDFTALVHQAPPSVLQESVARVFARLEKAVEALGGTVKEFQGDALFAFWERGSTNNHAADACRAAISLKQLTEELARDPSVWAVEEFPLKMDWALATGPVAISGYGGENVLGLSMVGGPVVLAFRIEKIASDTTGSIIACAATRTMVSEAFRFNDLGLKTVKGFDAPQRLYALVEGQ